VSRAEENELAFAGPLELARLVRERELRVRELVEIFLARIERLDPRLNAFRETLHDLALTTASQIDRGGTMEGAGPLAGVPIALKDVEEAFEKMHRGEVLRSVVEL
jgi:amidase